jgi:hypothetical protein
MMKNRVLKQVEFWIMVSGELLNTLQKLDRSDKLYIMQVLVSELAQAETDLIKPNQNYAVWSPYEAFEAADIMLKALQEDKSQNHV